MLNAGFLGREQVHVKPAAILARARTGAPVKVPGRPHIPDTTHLPARRRIVGMASDGVRAVNSASETDTWTGDKAETPGA